MNAPLRRSWTRFVSVRAGAIFLAEVGVFWLIVEAVNQSDYGIGDTGAFHDWMPPVALILIALGMAAGEAHFHLYRRAWTVASLDDAFAIGMAVIEATVLVTLANLVFPDGLRPLRVLAPG